MLMQMFKLKNHDELKTINTEQQEVIKNSEIDSKLAIEMLVENETIKKAELKEIWLDLVGIDNDDLLYIKLDNVNSPYIAFAAILPLIIMPLLFLLGYNFWGIAFLIMFYSILALICKTVSLRAPNYLVIQNQLDYLKRICADCFIQVPNFKTPIIDKENLTIRKHYSYDAEFELFYELNKDNINDLRKYKNIFDYQKKLIQNGIEQNRIIELIKEKYENEIDHQQLFDCEQDIETQTRIRINTRNKFKKVLFDIDDLRKDLEHFDEVYKTGYHIFKREFFDMQSYSRSSTHQHINHWITINKELDLIENMFVKNPELKSELVENIKTKIDKGCTFMEFKELLIQKRKEMEIIIISRI